VRSGDFRAALAGAGRRVRPSAFRTSTALAASRGWPQRPNRPKRARRPDDIRRWLMKLAQFTIFNNGAMSASASRSTTKTTRACLPARSSTSN
jgi:hypothetical protein